MHETPSGDRLAFVRVAFAIEGLACRVAFYGSVGTAAGDDAIVTVPV